jgi:hypothetical protein
MRNLPIRSTMTDQLAMPNTAQLSTTIMESNHSQFPAALVFEREGTFRFLDLPAEMRNLIYEFALEHVRIRIVRRPLISNESNQLKAEPSKLAYLGLTQSCTKIRREFRPLWLDAHVVVPEDAHIYPSCFSGGRSLKLAMSPRGRPDLNFLPLLKVLLIRPDIDIKIHTPRSLAQDDPTIPWVAALTRMLKNRTKQWLQHIADSDLTEAKINFGYVATYGALQGTLYHATV